MDKKQTIKKTAALLLGMAIAMGTTGCGFITKDSQKDLDQTVAEVRIQDVLKDDEAYSSIADKFASFNFSGEVKKRELISYYISIGYQYVESYGYSYEDTFNMLLNALVNREILGQEAAAYFLNKDTSLSAEGYATFKTNELNAVSAEEKALLEKYEDVLRFKYFLTKGGADSKEYDIAVYTLKKNINDSIDSIESSNYITAEEEEYEHEETRTLPTGVDTEIEDYYVAEGYDVYTGRNALGSESLKNYEKVEGSTVASRQKAYNAFLTNLQDYNLVSTTGKIENTSKVTSLEYYYVELASLLEQRLINNYYEALEEEISVRLDAEYVGAKYEEMFTQNKRDYEKNATSFGTAMDSVSADSFLLYAPINQNAEGEDMIFGYVYNILIPFSTSQSVAYTEAQNMGLTESTLYSVRRDIGAQVQGKDLRTSWISKHDHANYSTVNEENLSAPIYFFEENNGEKYEELTQYAGNYAFNGEVKEGDGDYELTPYKVPMDIEKENNFIKDVFEAYINETLDGTGVTASGAYLDTYATNDYYKVNEDGSYKLNESGKKEIDYNNFIYYKGKVNFSTADDKKPTAASFFDKNSEQYKALSAVNELMFAYSTDTGCLNTYMGYSVSPYGTNFVKEFEAAAQWAVKEGVGNYAVCLTDYGWHIVYCSFSYNAEYMGADNKVYGAYNHAEAVGDAIVEGSFSNLFYEYVKESAYTNYTTEVQNKTLKKYDNETCVTRYENRYNDLYDFEA